MEGDGLTSNDGRDEEKFHSIAVFFISQISLMLDNFGHQYICGEIIVNNIFAVNI